MAKIKIAQNPTFAAVVQVPRIGAEPAPVKFQFRYIRNVKLPFVFKPALVIGGVTHKALAEIFRNRRDGVVPQSHEAHATRYLRLE